MSADSFVASDVYDEQIIRRTFREYSSSSKYLGLFECRCAILATTGIELSKTSIREKIRHFQSLQALELTKPLQYDDSIDKGVSYDIFFAIVVSMLPERKILMKNMFDEVDIKSRGYITQEEFKSILSKYAPHLSCNRGAEIFKAMDRFGLGKVTFLQFLTSERLLDAEIARSMAC